MKRYILICAALTGCLVSGHALAGESSGMNPTVEVAGDGIARQGGYTFMGSLGTVSVDTQQAIWTIVVPAPQEEVLGTAPASISYEVNSSHQLVIVLRRNLVLDLMPGEQVTIEVGVKLPKEGIGVYGITLIGE